MRRHSASIVRSTVKYEVGGRAKLERKSTGRQGDAELEASLGCLAKPFLRTINRTENVEKVFVTYN